MPCFDRPGGRLFRRLLKVSPCVTTRVAASIEGQSLSGGWLVVDGVVAITRERLTLSLLCRAMKRGK